MLPGAPDLEALLILPIFLVLWVALAEVVINKLTGIFLPEELALDPASADIPLTLFTPWKCNSSTKFHMQVLVHITELPFYFFQLTLILLDFYTIAVGSAKPPSRGLLHSKHQSRPYPQQKQLALEAIARVSLFPLVTTSTSMAFCRHTGTRCMPCSPLLWSCQGVADGLAVYYPTRQAQPM